MNLTDEDKKTLRGLELAFNLAELDNAAFPYKDTFKFNFDLKICVLLRNVILEVLKDEKE